MDAATKQKLLKLTREIAQIRASKDLDGPVKDAMIASCKEDIAALTVLKPMPLFAAPVGQDQGSGAGQAPAQAGERAGKRA